MARLQPKLTPVKLLLRDTLHIAGDPIVNVYFPLSGWVSMLAPLDNGDVAEVGLIGKEGMVGIPVALGATHDGLEAMVQGEGTALSMRADSFREALGNDAALRASILRYTLAHLMQVSRTAACNVHHLVEQRLARWLLMSHDRADGDTFAMTHDFLGMMLGVRRAGISVAAGALQKAGLIHYERGTITITDRPGPRTRVANATPSFIAIIPHSGTLRTESRRPIPRASTLLVSRPFGARRLGR